MCGGKKYTIYFKSSSMLKYGLLTCAHVPHSLHSWYYRQNCEKRCFFSKNLIKYLIWKGTYLFFMKQTTFAQLTLPRNYMLNEGQFQSLHFSALVNAIPSENVTHPQLQGKQPFTKFL